MVNLSDFVLPYTSGKYIDEAIVVNASYRPGISTLRSLSEMSNFSQIICNGTHYKNHFPFLAVLVYDITRISGNSHY